MGGGPFFHKGQSPNFWCFGHLMPCTFSTEMRAQIKKSWRDLLISSTTSFLQSFSDFQPHVPRRVKATAKVTSCMITSWYSTKFWSFNRPFQFVKGEQNRGQNHVNWYPFIFLYYTMLHCVNTFDSCLHMAVPFEWWVMLDRSTYSWRNDKLDSGSS